MRRSPALLLFIALCDPGLSADLPFGADGLPHLVRVSNSIVEVQRVTAVERSETATLYSVTIAQSLKGDLKAPQPIVLLVPTGLDLKSTEELTGAIVFLSAPLNSGDLVAQGIRPQDTVREALSGRLGIVPRTAPARLTALLDYMKTASQAERLEWAALYSRHIDPRLQRSALLELVEPGQSVASPVAFSTLVATLSAPAVVSENKSMALDLLGRTQRSDAAAPIARFAEDARVSDALRVEAMRAIGSLPNGGAALRELKTRQDSVLVPAVDKVLHDLDERSRRGPAPKIEDVRSNLASADLALRELGTTQAIEYGFSAEILALLAKAAVDTASPASVQLSALEGLASFNNLASALALERIALDRTLPKDSRGVAIMGLGKLDAGIGNPILKRVQNKAEPGELRDLAAGLAKGR